MIRESLKIFAFCALATASVAQAKAEKAKLTPQEVTSAISDPDDAHKIGRSYLETDEYEKAIEALEHAVNQNPTLTQAWYRLAIAYAKLGQLEKSDRALAVARGESKPKGEKPHSQNEDLENVLKVINQPIEHVEIGAAWPEGQFALISETKERGYLNKSKNIIIVDGRKFSYDLYTYEDIGADLKNGIKPGTYASHKRYTGVVISSNNTELRIKLTQEARLSSFPHGHKPTGVLREKWPISQGTWVFHRRGNLIYDSSNPATRFHCFIESKSSRASEIATAEDEEAELPHAGLREKPPILEGHQLERSSEQNADSGRNESSFDRSAFAKRLFAKKDSFKGLYAVEPGGRPEVKVTNKEGKYFVSFLHGSGWTDPEGLHSATKSELSELFSDEEAGGVCSALVADGGGSFALAKVEKGTYWGSENDSGYIMFMMITGGNVYKVSDDGASARQTRAANSTTLSREEALKTLRANARSMAVHGEVPIGKGINIEMLIKTLMRQAPTEARFINGLYVSLQELEYLNFYQTTKPMFGSSLTTTDISVTSKGLKHGVVLNERYFSGSHTYRFRMADRMASAVSGIRQFGHNKCKVNFKYNHTNFSEIHKASAAQNSDKVHYGSAIFTLYDDGWRLESFDFKN